MTICTIDKWMAGDWHTCLFQATTDLVGETTFGLLVGAALWTALYLAGGGRSTAPTVVVILLATIMFPVLPNAFVGIAWSVLVVGAVAAVVQIAQKYVLSPGTM